MTTSIAANLLWGVVMALIPITFIGLKYISNPVLSEELVPFEYYLRLIPIMAVLNLALNYFVAPIIKNSDYAFYSTWIIGAIIGLVIGFYMQRGWPNEVNQRLFQFKKPQNLYAQSVFYWSLINGLFIPYLQRQVCLHGPRGY